jgi:transposase-like protein
MPSKYVKRNTAYINQPHSGKKAPESEGSIALKIAMGTYADDNAAREFLEKARWPEGAFCPHCGGHEVTKLQGKATRPGVYKCKSKGCRKQFTVTVGTIFEASHIKLRNWVIAFHAMCAGKKGVSAHQLHRTLGITYKSAWFMCHRIRHAMDKGLEAPLTGVVEGDEMWVGGKPRPKAGAPRTAQGKKKYESKKVPVAVLVQRGGPAVCKPIENAGTIQLRKAAMTVADEAVFMTDSLNAYDGVGTRFAAHHTVNHTRGEYARNLENGLVAHNNTAESFFAIFKRGFVGIYHKMSEKHLPRYCNEFSFRFSHRDVSDSERTLAAIEGAEGKRLTYK